MNCTDQIINNTDNQVLKAILLEMEMQILDRVDVIVKANDANAKAEVERLRRENPTRKFSDARMTSEWERQCIEMGLVYDLVRALCQYTLDTDEVESFNSGLSMKGNFEINGTITRDGKQYDLSTEVIIAEGPIVRAHYRYITKTNLPKSSDSSEAKKVKQMITKRNKMQTIKNEIATWTRWIEDDKAEIVKMEAYTDEDWFNAMTYPKLEETFKSVAEFDAWQQENWRDMTGYRAWLSNANAEKLEREKKQIQFKKGDINRWNKAIAKAESKLEKLQYSK